MFGQSIEENRMRKLILLLAVASPLVVMPGCGGGPTASPQPNTPTPPPVAQALHYRIVDLPPIEAGSNGNAVSHGHAVGYFVSTSDDLFDHATFWHDGVADDLGRGNATAINGADQIIVNGEIWEHGTITNIGGFALAINDSGQAIGETTDAPGRESSFTWTLEGGARPITSSILPVAINSVGDLAGQGPNDHAMIFTNTGENIDLGTLPGDTSSEAVSINVQGHAVGRSDSGVAMIDPFLGTPYFPTHAFFWDGQKMQDLGALQAGFLPIPISGSDVPNATATGVNDADMVVGYDSYDVGLDGSEPASVLDATVPFVWSVATGLIDLNTLVDPGSGWQLRIATGIDQDGEIVGIGVAPDGAYHGFMLVPEN
jgi:hypothetical protein